MSTCEYGLCDGSGFIVDEETRSTSDCRCRPARISARRVRRLEGQIPKRYREMSFESSEVIDIERRCGAQVRELRSYVAAIERNLDQGSGLWLTGGFGTGKTALAMIASRSAIDAGRAVAIYSCPRLLAVLRDAIDRGEVLDFLDRLAAVDLLHIDDLGAERATDWVIEQLYCVINARYEEERSIIVTSNLDRDQLSAQIGERIVSRLEGMCEMLPFYGEDARRVSYPAELRPAVGGS